MACPKFVRQTFHEVALHSIGFSEWARAYYDEQRARGKSHHAAVAGRAGPPSPLRLRHNSGVKLKNECARGPMGGLLSGMRLLASVAPPSGWLPTHRATRSIILQLYPGV